MKKIRTLITLKKAKNIISDYVNYKTEVMDIQYALSRCLAQAVTAPEKFPAFDRSLYDGYAVNSKNRTGIKSIEFLRISTGQILPVNTDSVIMLEDTVKTGDKIIASSKIMPGQNVILAGEDFKKGELIFNKGFKLRPQDIGLLQGMGIKKVKVFKKLSVGIVSSGNEIVSLGNKPGYGQVRDMNSGMLSNLVKQAGGEPVFLGICPDRKETIVKFIKKINKHEIDLIILTGGTSVGDSDILEDALSSLRGSRILFHGLRTKPGKSTLAAYWKGCLIVGLPGRPSSAFVVFHLLVKTILKYFCCSEIMLEAVLGENITADYDKEEYLPVLLEQKKGILYAWPVKAKPSLFSPLTFSQGAIKIPIGRKIIKKGQIMEALLWNDL